jgi:transposase
MSGSATATSCRPTRSAKKKRLIRRRLRGQPRYAVKLAEDETDLRLFPPLRSGWARRGQPAPVPISGGNAKRVLFGALNLRTGHRVFLVRRQQRGVDQQAFLQEVRRHYPGRHVALLLDEDSSHTAGASQELAGELDIELLWLPKRSPHLNPMDHLWRHGKEVKSANHQYGSIEVQAERFIAYLGGLSRQEALRKAGVLSEDFWLKGVL